MKNHSLVQLGGQIAETTCEADELTGSPRRYSVIWYGSLVILVALLLGRIGDGTIRETFFDSDNLYLSALFDDLVRWSGRISDWRLTPAPYFFPDMPLYFMARVTTGAVEPAQYLSGILHLLLFVRSARWLVQTWMGTNITARIAGFFVVILAIVHLAGGAALFGALYHLTNHGGAALMSLVVLTLCAGGRSRLRSLSAATLALLAGISDPLFAASCGAPLLLLGACASIPFVWNRVSGIVDSARASVRNRTLVAGATAFLGAWLANVVHEHVNPLPNLHRAPPSLELLLAVLSDLSHSARPVGIWVLVGALLACTILVLPCRGSQARGLRVIALWHVGSVIATLAAIAWTGNYLDSGSLRYMVVPFAMTTVLTCSIVAHALSVHAHHPVVDRMVSLTANFVIVALITALVTQVPSMIVGHYRSDWRSTASCVLAVLRQERSVVVLTDYWQAKPLMVFSDGKIRALQMRAKLRRPYFWINSRGWYRGRHRFGVVAVKDLDPDSIIRSYGEPARVASCSGLDLFVYQNGARDKLANKMQRMFDHFVVDPHPL